LKGKSVVRIREYIRERENLESGRDPVTRADRRAGQQGKRTSAYTTAPPLDSAQVVENQQGRSFGQGQASFLSDL